MVSNLQMKAAPFRAQYLYSYTLPRTKAEGIEIMMHKRKEVCLARISMLPIQ